MSSKKKKMAKLKRVMAQVKRQDRREKRDTDQTFAAIQLLHDPQVALLSASSLRTDFGHGAQSESVCTMCTKLTAQGTQLAH